MKNYIVMYFKSIQIQHSKYLKYLKLKYFFKNVFKYFKIPKHFYLNAILYNTVYKYDLRINKLVVRFECNYV